MTVYGILAANLAFCHIYHTSFKLELEIPQSNNYSSTIPPSSARYFLKYGQIRGNSVEFLAEVGMNGDISYSEYHYVTKEYSRPDKQNRVER
jgi:hypothetical protein